MEQCNTEQFISDGLEGNYTCPDGKQMIYMCV